MNSFQSWNYFTLQVRTFFIRRQVKSCIEFVGTFACACVQTELVKQRRVEATQQKNKQISRNVASASATPWIFRGETIPGKSEAGGLGPKKRTLGCTYIHDAPIPPTSRHCRRTYVVLTVEYPSYLVEWVPVFHHLRTLSYGGWQRMCIVEGRTTFN